MWDLPGPGLEPVYPALAGGFLTTAPPGKSTIFILMYLVGWLYFLTLEKWPFVGDILYVPAAHFSLVTRSVCSQGVPYVGCVGPFVMEG